MKLVEELDKIYNETLYPYGPGIYDKCEQKYEAIIEHLEEVYWEFRNEGYSHQESIEQVTFKPLLWLEDWEV